MTHAIGDRTCAVVGCTERVDVHADGRCVHSRCPNHETSALSDAFTNTPVMAAPPEPEPIPAAYLEGWTSGELVVAFGK